MDFDPEKILEILQKLLQGAGINPPLWLTQTIAWVVLVGVLLCAVWGLLYVLSQIKELASKFVPPRLNRETRRRLDRRRRFAEHVESEVRRLNNEQSWSDYRFAELEAEVEAEGRRRAVPFLPLFLPRTTSGLRREKSLTKAIDVSRERLILIEGDPGSGKSVALRYVATKLAGRAMQGGLQTVIPIYINLKEIERPQDRRVDRNLVEEFILKTLNRVNNRDVEEYLEEEFRKGMVEGTWLFLFDSFDEIPEILGSTEPDTVIRDYAQAIDDFLHGMNRCRGVVASRYFRGPGQVVWPRFRIMPLSPVRREDLVRKADLPGPLERELLGRLPLLSEKMGDQAKNPLFLSLICEHMKSGRPFPESGHAVFESYVDQRLTRDAERIARRFNVEILAIRRIAEQVAFCMAADPGLGLSPAREKIPEALSRHGFEVRSILPTCLDALEFIKLARSESGMATGSERLFTFAHRRFQEYFATCLVLASPDRVSPRGLLLDGRWRETATVIFQTAPPSSLAPLLTEARSFFQELWNSAKPKSSATPGDASRPHEFPWPPGSLHVLGLLQEGFAGRIQELPEDIRSLAGQFVSAVIDRGLLADRKWALEVCGAVDEATLLEFLRKAFRGESRWLAEVAYRQAGRLAQLPADICAGVLAEMARIQGQGRFWRERHATATHLSRLDKPQRFMWPYRLFLALPFLDAVAHCVVAALVLSTFATMNLLAVGSLLSIAISWRLLWLIPNFPLYPVVLMRIGFIGSIFGAELHSNLIAAIYLVAWAPVACWVAKKGRFVRPAWWPFLIFLWPLVWRPKIILKETLVLVSVIGGCSVLGLLAERWLGFLQYMVPLIAIGWLTWAVAIFASDLVVLQKLRRSGKRMEVHALIEALHRLKIPRLRIYCLRRVRELTLLLPSVEAEAQIAELAAIVEKPMGKKDKKGPYWGPETLDELCRLRESLRTEPIAAPLPPDQIEGAA